MTATVALIDAALKPLIKNSNYMEIGYSANPLLGMLPKMENFVGRNMPIVINYGKPQGVSGTFSKSQANRSTSKFEDFLLTRKKLYGNAAIEGEALDASASDDGSFVRGLIANVQHTLESVSGQLETHLFRAGTGSMGTIGSVSTNSLVLANINDIVNFELGQTIAVSATDGASHRTGVEVVGGINEDAGALTSTSVTWATTISAIQAGDHVYVEGNLNTIPEGLASWIPTAAPSATPFYGVDRTLHVTRLAGHRYDASSSGDTVEEALITLASKITRMPGARPDVVLLNPSDYRRLLMSQASRVNFPRVTTSARNSKGDVASISFTGVELQANTGVLKVVPCPKCPELRAYILQMDTWALNSLGPAPKILQNDGQTICRQTDADAYEVRIGLYGNLGCKAPGFNGVCLLPSA